MFSEVARSHYSRSLLEQSVTLISIQACFGNILLSLGQGGTESRFTRCLVADRRPELRS